jgi:hypothetical protein
VRGAALTGFATSRAPRNVHPPSHHHTKHSPSSPPSPPPQRAGTLLAVLCACLCCCCRPLLSSNRLVFLLIDATLELVRRSSTRRIRSRPRLPCRAFHPPRHQSQPPSLLCHCLLVAAAACLLPPHPPQFSGLSSLARRCFLVSALARSSLPSRLRSRSPLPLSPPLPPSSPAPVNQSPESMHHRHLPPPVVVVAVVAACLLSPHPLSYGGPGNLPSIVNRLSRGLPPAGYVFSAPLPPSGPPPVITICASSLCHRRRVAVAACLLSPHPPQL